MCLDIRELRALVIEIVLATDMSFHFQQVKNMKNLLSMPEKSVVSFCACHSVLYINFSFRYLLNRLLFIG